MDAQAVILSLVASGETETKKIHATLVKEFQESAPSHNQVKKQFAAIRRGAEAEKKAKIDAANDRIKTAIQTRDSAAIKKAVRKNKEDAAPHIVDMAKRHIEQLSQGPKLNTKSLKVMERARVNGAYLQAGKGAAKWEASEWGVATVARFHSLSVASPH